MIALAMSTMIALAMSIMKTIMLSSMQPQIVNGVFIFCVLISVTERREALQICCLK